MFCLDPRLFLRDPHARSELDERITLEEIYAGGPRAAANHVDPAECSSISQPENGGSSAHVYGDTDCDLLFPLFRELRNGCPITREDVFYDLGSGNGRLCLQMLLFTPIERSVGVELSATRHKHAVVAQAEACRLGLASRQQLRLFHRSMLEQPLGDATLVFCYNLCLDDAFLLRLRRRLAEQLPNGATVLVRGKPLLEPETHAQGVEAEVPSRGDATCAAGQGAGRRRLALRLRLTMWYGYRVVDVEPSHPAAVTAVTTGPGTGADIATARADIATARADIATARRSEAAMVSRPALKQASQPLGPSAFERTVFHEVDEPGTSSAAAAGVGGGGPDVLSDLAIMVALKPDGPDRDALEALLRIETRDRRQEAQPAAAPAGDAAPASRDEDVQEHHDPLLPLTTPPGQAGRHMSHGDLQQAQRVPARVISSLLDAEEIATLLSCGMASAALILDGRTRTEDGLLYDVSYEHDGHTSLFLHRQYAPDEGAPSTSLARDHAPTARVCDKLLGVMRDHLRAEPQDGVHADALSVRCIELHTYTAGGGLVDVRHRDCGSVLSLSVMLSEPAAKTGGHFVTWERGMPVVHQLEQGSAILFHSEKRHNISPLVRGLRQTLVIEMWGFPATVNGREN